MKRQIQRTRRSTTRPSIPRTSPRTTTRCPDGYRWNHITKLCDPYSPKNSPLSPVAEQVFEYTFTVLL